ncbi:MAG: hypothetical protein ACOH2G_08565 [Ewingella sp.]
MDRAIILASGPSLCAEDVTAALASGWPVIAVNNTWERAPGCSVIYAGDVEWWEKYRAVIDSPAERWTCHPRAAQRFGLHLHVAKGAYNSGQRAIQFAAGQGAQRVILLGFDCSLSNGTHWHGDHSGLRNPTECSIGRWQRHFTELAGSLAHISIINASRSTSLTCFPKQTLSAALAGAPLSSPLVRPQPVLSRPTA